MTAKQSKLLKGRRRDMELSAALMALATRSTLLASRGGTVSALSVRWTLTRDEAMLGAGGSRRQLPDPEAARLMLDSLGEQIRWECSVLASTLQSAWYFASDVGMRREAEAAAV